MTGSSCWPGYLGVVASNGCLDLIDHYRLLAYITNCAPRGFKSACSACPELGFADGVARVLGCPDTDPAPWYNPTDPAWVQNVAARFYGPEVISWEPQPVGYVGTSNSRVSHRPRRGKMRIEATVRLWGDGCDATLYGLEWFQRALECQVCSGLQLRTLRSCDVTFDTADPYGTGGNWWRDIFAARILVDPVPAPTDRPDTCCFFRDVDIVIEADDSCEYWVEPSVECVIEAPWLAASAEDANPDVCRCGPLCPCAEPVAACVGDCLPEPVSARAALSAVRVGCYCVPFSSCRKVCEIPSAATPGLSDGVLSVVVASVGAPTENLRIWVWRADASDGPGTSAAAWARWRCRTPCTTIDVGALRADDVLTIDGRDRTVQVARQTETCELEVTSMGDPLFWPTLNCADSFWIAVEYDTYATSPGLTVTTAVYPRECWSA